MEFEKKVIELDVNDVLPNRFQPRIKFNEDSINELSESIKEHGVIQPIVVRAMGDKYEIIAGERRYKASLLAGKSTIPAVITDLNDKDSAEVALIENVQRKDLTPIEEAISYKKILDMGYLTQEELAVKLGKTQSTVANKLRLLNLDEDVQEAVLEEKISERHARSLLKLNDMSEQRKMLAKIIENRLTVRKTDEEISKLLNGEQTVSTIPTPSIPVESVSDVNSTEQLIDPFEVSPISNDKLTTIGKENVVSDNYMEEPIVIIDDMDEIPTVSEDDITVDPAVQPTQFKVEDTVVDNNMLDNINIPTAPIETAPQPVTPVVDDSMIVPTLSDNPTTNPGFMNIDKIESEAKNINEEKPEVDINSLLKPTIMAEEPKEETNVEEEIPAPKEGKFFTLPDDVNVDESTENQNNPNPSPLDAFDFAVTTPVSASTPEEIPASTVPDIQNLVSNDPAPIVEPVETQVAAPVETLTEILDESPTPVSTPSNVPPITEPIPTETLDIPVEPVPSQPETPNVLNPEFDFNISAPVTREELVEPAPSQPETPVEASNPVANKSFNQALNLVRETISSLEKMGYGINTEEFDFETAYQIVIKIDK